MAERVYQSDLKRKFSLLFLREYVSLRKSNEFKGSKAVILQEIVLTENRLSKRTLCLITLK